jgi:hypothetical protein
MSAPWLHGDPRAVAQSVLADPRFRDAAGAPVKPWWSYLLDALAPWWHRLIDPLRRAVGDAAATRAVGIAVLVVVLAFLLFVVVRFARRTRLQRPAREAIDAVALETGADARTLLARARKAAAAGRNHEAAALLWASALRALDERGRVRYDPARTPGEWRRLVGDAAFDALARDAVVAMFGDRAPDEALVARMRESYDRIVAPA